VARTGRATEIGAQANPVAAQPEKFPASQRAVSGSFPAAGSNRVSPDLLVPRPVAMLGLPLATHHRWSAAPARTLPL